MSAADTPYLFGSGYGPANKLQETIPKEAKQPTTEENLQLPNATEQPPLQDIGSNQDSGHKPNECPNPCLTPIGEPPSNELANDEPTEHCEGEITGSQHTIS